MQTRLFIQVFLAAALSAARTRWLPDRHFTDDTQQLQIKPASLPLRGTVLTFPPQVERRTTIVWQHGTAPDTPPSNLHLQKHAPSEGQSGHDIVRESSMRNHPDTDGLFGATATWHYLDYFPLARVVRQADSTFSTILTKIGDGRALDEEDVRLLDSRFVSAEEALACAVGSPDLLLKRRGRALQHTPHVLDNAKRKVDKMATSEFGNLPREILLVVGKPYMITSNIAVVDGLVNGAVGTLKLCERQAAGNDDAYPKRLWLQFDVPTTGRITCARSKRAVQEATRNEYVVESAWIPIEPQSLTLTIDRKSGVACKRLQFPLVQASAITVHKSQGGTYSEVVYEYAKTHPQKLVYVALSSCTDINTLYLANSSADHCFHHKDTNADKNMAVETREGANEDRGLLLGSSWLALLDNRPYWFFSFGRSKSFSTSLNRTPVRFESTRAPKLRTEFVLLKAA
ncbi:uncharacterized protein ISCGN_022736 [Ixodes scapularis]